MNQPRTGDEHALEHLELPLTTPPGEVRGGFFRELQKQNWLPNEGSVAAFARFSGAYVPETSDVKQKLEHFERLDLNQFLRQFWQMTPTERRVKFDSLKELCRSRAVLARLRQLEPGLNVEVLPHADPFVEETAKLYRELFVLSGSEQAQRLAQWLAEGKYHAGWPEIWSSLVKADPALANLDPKLANWLNGSTVAMPSLGSKVGAAQKNSASQPGVEMEIFGFKDAETGPRRPVAGREESVYEPSHRQGQTRHDGYDYASGGSENAGRSESGSRGRWNTKLPESSGSSPFRIGGISVGVVIGIFMIIRVIVGLSSSTGSRSSTYPTVPNYAGTTSYYPSPNLPNVNLSEEQQMACTLYDPKTKDKPPPGYSLMRLSGVKLETLEEGRRRALELHQSQILLRKKYEEQKALRIRSGRSIADLQEPKFDPDIAAILKKYNLTDPLRP
jgi:hypothetical protein